ncbi:MAG: CCDC90 family protein [Magnetococcus sp. DMHC-1]|nr:DUF1640 domain-containing protein [Magnetococcales bacterium]
MTTIAFDTLKYVKTLRAAGFEERQAEGLAEAQAEVFDHNLEELTTKRDLRELDTKWETRFKELELRIAAEIAPLKWGVAVCVAGITALLIKSVFPH